MPQNKTVIIDRPSQLVLQVFHELLREKRVIVDGGGLTENIHLGVVDELFQEMLLTIRVCCAIKMSVPTAQSTFEHLEYFFIPGSHFVAIGVFDGHALNTGNVLLAVRAQNMHSTAKQPGRVVAADGPHKGLSPDLPHGVQNIPAEGSLRVAQHDGRPLAPQGQKALGNDHGIVQPALAGTSGSDFQIPAVGAGSEIFFLFSR